eukprot:4621161-Pyramimonas_sp.AAC.1
MSSEDKREFAIATGLATNPRDELDVACEWARDYTDDEEVRPQCFYNQPRSVAQAAVRGEVPKGDHQGAAAQAQLVRRESSCLDAVEKLGGVGITVIHFGDGHV